MAIVSCDHHSGMGLCSDCAREQHEAYAREDRRGRDTLRDNAPTLRAAADILERAGEYGLARQIREKIPRY